MEKCQRYPSQRVDVDNKNLNGKYFLLILQGIRPPDASDSGYECTAHTRDDMHVPYVDGEPYEVYTKENSTDLDYTLEPFPYWGVSINPNAPKQFWDLDHYTGAIAYDSGYIGLSEYTHANFLSKDTIFKYFPHPDPTPSNTNYYDFDSLPYTS